MCSVFDVYVVLCVVCGEGRFGRGCKEHCVCCVFDVCVVCVVCLMCVLCV